MEIQIYKKDQLAENIDDLAFAMESFDYGDHDWCKKIVQGSQMFVVGRDGDELIGFGRTVGDGVRFSYIVDLNVQTSKRRQGIGTKLVRELAKNSKTTFIELTNDPQFPWLKEFYLKAGFVLSDGASVFEWPE